MRAGAILALYFSPSEQIVQQPLENEVDIIVDTSN
jgi:hypothetical protein